jgi:hypothetical protein
MRLRSRSRFIRRLVALGWFVAILFGGVYLSTAWWPGVVHLANQAVDAETLDRLLRGAGIGAVVGAALFMTRWSWMQLRHGGLARLWSYLRRRD